MLKYLQKKALKLRTRQPSVACPTEGGYLSFAESSSLIYTQSKHLSHTKFTWYNIVGDTLC